MTDAILEVRDLDMHFPTGAGLFGKATGVVRAVDSVSFTVQRGETFGIVGESGSGKTTLGRCIMRIHDPTDGVVTYSGKNWPPVDLVSQSREDLRSIWRDIRMVLQDRRRRSTRACRLSRSWGKSCARRKSLGVRNSPNA